MMFDPDTHHRRSIRLTHYDYSQAGAYFVTISTQNRQCFFGGIADEEMALNDAGAMVEKWWHELQNKYANIALDCFIVMPNHFHGIIIINPVGADLCVCPDPHADLYVCPDSRADMPAFPDGLVCPDLKKSGEHAGSPLPAMIQWFKTMTTNEYIRHVKQKIWPPFAGRLWQRNYYEHVMRDDDDLNRIREYICNNPLRWADDPDYMAAEVLS